MAAGVLTALPGDAAGPPAPGVCDEVPRLLPVVRFPRALEVWGPGDPPVPLMVLPLDSVDPDDAPDVPPPVIA